MHILEQQIEHFETMSTLPINSKNTSGLNSSVSTVVSLCCATLPLHMYCMDLDETWHEYCQNLVNENHIVELVGKVLGMFLEDELIQVHSKCKTNHWCS